MLYSFIKGILIGIDESKAIDKAIDKAIKVIMSGYHHFNAGHIASRALPYD